MNFNDHSKFKDQHAFLSPSKYSWLNYSPEQLYSRYKSQFAAPIGTALHSIASSHIKLGFKLTKRDERHVLYELLKSGFPRNVVDITDEFPNLANFVNDAIGFGMESEQTLLYSENCFGTSDAISFEKDLLRIHDYKSGSIAAHMDQLNVYSALFCLEYKKNPNEIQIEERIYQFGEIAVYNPTPEEIFDIMEKIIAYDNMITRFKNEGF